MKNLFLHIPFTSRFFSVCKIFRFHKIFRNFVFGAFVLLLLPLGTSCSPIGVLKSHSATQTVDRVSTNNASVPQFLVCDRSFDVPVGIDNHAQDVLSVGEASRSFSVHFGFHQGVVRKSVSNGFVEVLLDTCLSNLVPVLAGVTNNAGVFSANFPSDMLNRLNPGKYRIWYRLQNGKSWAWANLFRLMPGRELAVFDIDGTLTTSDGEVFKETLSRFLGESAKDTLLWDKLGDWWLSSGNLAFGAKVRMGAENATHSVLQKGIFPIYLTGRPENITSLTRDWLSRNQFAEGVLKLAPSLHDVIPKDDGVGQFKFRVLSEMKALHLSVVEAYGNATTDINAYENFGVPKERTFILGKHGGEKGTVNLGETFSVL